MYVFRDGRRSLRGTTLVDGLATALRELSSSSEAAAGWHSQTVIDALLRAGELECGLTDAGSPEGPRLSRLTDLLADLLAGSPGCVLGPEPWINLLPREVPALLQLAPAEGFAYYALHPLDFADLAAVAPLSGGDAAVIGIRSIGATLSAVVAAALRRRGIRTERITVRPEGHPYDRHTEFSPAEREWVERHRTQAADFLVVDEGPGMSGSSFLSVGEALLAAGVERERVLFLCSRWADGSTLCARDAATRWAGFRSLAARPATRLPQEATSYLGGGYWRHQWIGPDPACWPASWSQMERMKFLSPDSRTFFKFVGLGRFGEEVLARSRILSEAGYAPAPAAAGDGFLRQAFVPGKILTLHDLDREVLDGMAQYCALRQRGFLSPEEQAPGELETMLRFNVSEEFGVDLPEGYGRLFADRPVMVDGRMLPHEWVRAREDSSASRTSEPGWKDGWLMKCDGASHGDDHFFPGPATDICWDLAGAIVEWGLGRDATGYFLRQYRSASGDDASHRLAPFLLAYAVFRLGHCKMGAEAMKGSDEETRLLAAYRYYRGCAAGLLRQRQKPAEEEPRCEPSEVVS
jgi:hypothetical protein